MKTIKITTILIAAIAILGISCKNKLRGKGPIESQTFTVGSFSKVDLSYSANVNYAYGEKQSVIIQAQQNVLDRMEIKTSGNTLQLDFKNRTRLLTYDEITVTITSPAFNGASISGAGNVNVFGEFTTGDVNIDVSGAGKIEIQSIFANRMYTDVSGSGDVRIFNGKVDYFETNISGAGSVDAFNLESKAASVSTSGAGTTKVWATEKLTVDISGSGSTTYKGTPAVEVDISGSGSLNAL